MAHFFLKEPSYQRRNLWFTSFWRKKGGPGKAILAIINHNKSWSFSKEGYVAYRLGLKKLYYKFLSQAQTLNTDNYCFQLDQLKALINEKQPELTNQGDFP